MSSKQTAAPSGSGVGPSRRKWDADEFQAKAKARDDEDRARAKENEERLKKGKKPLARRRLDLPKPTELMKQRDAPLDLDKNLNKTLMVENVEGGRKGSGFYCDVCRKTCKDSIGYLDHINGRMHLRRLGQTTQVARSTVEQVRARINLLRAQTADKANARAYDFDARLREIADREKRHKEERKAKRKAEREAKRARTTGGGEAEADAEMMAAMGFGGFGSTKNK